MTEARISPRDPRAAPSRPQPSPLQGYDPIWLLLVNAGVIAYMWVKHGGPERIETQGWLIAVGQLTGLYAALAALLGLVLISRAPWLERRYGMDRTTHFHRYTGFTAFSLMAVHVVTVTIGYAWDSDLTIWDQIVDSIENYPYVLNAVIGFGLIAVVAFSSLKIMRRRLAYEHWWFIHLGTYVGMALAFGHQTAVGSDFVKDGWSVAYWALLYISVAALILGFRWITPVVLAMRHHLKVAQVQSEGDGVVTVVMHGTDLDRLPAQAGQFFLLRVMSRGRWWKAHPFSLSAPPDGRTLRFTIKAIGDDTRYLQAIPVGTPVALEGPYGGFLPFRDTDKAVLYIAGGIGITPFRGLIDDLPHPERVALLYRCRTQSDAVFLEDLTRLSSEKGFAFKTTFSRNDGTERNPFVPERLREFVPDVAEREVFVVGSPRLISAARAGLRAAGVPARQIHYENFSY